MAAGKCSSPPLRPRVIDMRFDGLLLGLVIGWLAPVGAGADALDDFLQDLHGFQAHFEQTVFDVRGQPLEQTSGRLYLAPPDRFHWSYQTPYQQQIISDGENVWLYDRDLEQVIARTLAQTSATPAMIFSDPEQLQHHFERRELEQEDEYHWLELRPRADDSEYQSLRLAFHATTRLPARLIISDQLQQTTRIDFSRARRNPVLDDALFTLRIAPGVELIDERHGN